ncbi:MAG: hypothetical protein LBK75_06315 [Oscillospiraceae bacterium]|jgi:rubrerythrin|nr:hypothetical protein [Oscillospiraceae bacterium]MDR2670265.1 hypothetical protein [Oscillospiraceae bacterium]
MANLTTKECSALKDLLGTEQILVKKYRTMAGQCTDAALKNQFTGIAARHQRHFDTLTNHLR